MLEGRAILNQLIDTFELCPKLCFIQNNTEPCTGAAKEECACTGVEAADAYNQKVNLAIAELNKALPTFAIRDEGRTDDEHSCILVEKGKFYGMGYISHYFDVESLQQLKNYLTPYPGNDYIKNLVANYAERYPQRKVMFV